MKTVSSNEIELTNLRQEVESARKAAKRARLSARQHKRQKLALACELERLLSVRTVSCINKRPQHLGLHSSK
ncbi:unnamed protein product [Protopolystoma xenopodis]|uniref:Uncharacterized protein n=1 Tax=Protopolystoma xenopodis TaxID=117903 RepID=A0A3S5A4F5_9PLAT|nr:unnamed protein product [Protopolystoma xenopodis]